MNRTLYIRTLSGIGLLIVVLGTVLWSPYSMLALMAFLTAGAMREFYRIARLSEADPLMGYPMAIGVIAVVMAFMVKAQWIDTQWLVCLLPLVFLLFIFELYRNRPTSPANIAWAIAGIIYVALPMALFATLPIVGSNGVIEYSPIMILSILFIVWANDVGAYLFGVTFGRHKLFERISPNKSWEGFFGGVICAIGVGALAGWWQQTSVAIWAGAGAVISISGVFGDLIESMFKRSVQIKDSGNIMPGHGGFLDRFDALFLAVPFVYTYFTLIFTT